MTAPPYLPRQLELLSRMMPVSRNPICLTVYDTQGVAPLIMYLAGFEGAYEEIRDGVAWFRMTNYLPTGEKLVDRIRDAAESTSLIFLHVGGTQLPDSVLHLLEFIASQSFAVPRIIVVCEALDVACGNDNLRTLFSRVGSHLDLRAGGA